VPHAFFGNQGFESLQALEFFPAAVTTHDMRFYERRVRRIELTIDEPAQQQLLISARSHLLHAPRLFPGVLARRQQLFREHRSSACQAGHHGADRNSGYLGDLSIGKLLEISKDDGFPEGLRNGLDRLTNSADGILPLDLLLRGRTGVRMLPELGRSVF
jgi:hypothetical protein